MANQTSVLFLPTWYPHKYDSMFGLFICRHIEAISPYIKNAIVLYVHPSDYNTKTKYELEFIKRGNIHEYKIYYKKFKSKISFINLIINTFRYVNANRKGLKKIKKAQASFDIIHVNILTRAGVIAYYFKLFKNIPYIITEHWSRYQERNGTYKGYLRKLLTKFVVRKSSKITTVTSDLKKAMQRHNIHGEYEIIPNVVDISKFNLAEKKAKGSRKKIIHISCFEDKSKNISGLLRAIQLLSKQRDDFQLDLVGTGIDFEKMKAYAEKLGLYNRFAFFHGLLEGDPLIEEIKNSDLMVLFSNYENLPVVLLEGYACGLPILSTDVGGISEFFNNKLGKLSEIENEELFAEKIDKMLNNLEKYDKQYIRQYAIANFSNEVIGKKFLSLYEEILKGKNSNT